MEENKNEIYRNLHDAIETENVEETEKLVNLLTEDFGMTEEIKMPEDFVSQIKRKDEKNTMRTKKRMLKAAAAGFVAVCALGGTTYAATHWNFDKVHFSDNGFIAGDVDEDTAVVIQDSLAEETTNTDTNESSSEVLEDIDGTDDTNWVHKQTSLETDTRYIFDEKGNTQQEMFTYKSIDYTYDCMEKLRADNVLPDIFTDRLLKNFSLTDDKITYTELYQEETSKDLTSQNLTASYRSGKKKMELFLNKDYMYQEALSNDDATVISSYNFVSDGEQTAENQRYYTTKSNVEFALEDVTSDGNTHTIAYLSGNGYTLSIDFYHMSEQEINQALEQVDAPLLLE